MKNTVYALAAREPVGEPEAFGLRLARHFLDRNPKLRRVRVDLDRPRLGADRRRRPRARTRRSCAAAPTRERRRCSAGATARVVGAGVADLLILKSARSAFCGLPAGRVHHAARDARSAAGDVADRDVALRRRRGRVRRVLAGRPPDAARDVRRTRQRVGAAHALRDGPGGARRVRRRGGDPPGDAEQAPSADRPVALRPREPQRDLRRHRGAVRADRGHAHASTA